MKYESTFEIFYERFLLPIFWMCIGMLLLCSGCAGRKPVAQAPQVPSPYWATWSDGGPYLTCPNGWLLIDVNRCEQISEPVPGHPSLHYGPSHLECSIGNDCQIVRDWLTADNKQVLSPGGCWIAKHLYFTRLLGDSPSMCEKK